MTEIITPVGRLVGGHPFKMHPVKDDRTGHIRKQKDGTTDMVQCYIGLAIAKGAETDWRQTEWGAAIYNTGVAAFPAGEHAQPAFSWKVTDGDSTALNKNMKRPCDKEGFPGHWVINASNGFPVKAYYPGKYNPLTDQITDPNAIKCGDYARLVLNVEGNGAVAPNTPGVYVNPSLFELYQAGVAIISASEPDAQGTLGATQGQLPQGALIDPNVPQGAGGGVQAPPPVQQPGMAPPVQQPGMAPPPPVQPATDFVSPPPPAPIRRVLNGVTYTEAQLVQAGYKPEQIAALPSA